MREIEATTELPGVELDGGAQAGDAFRAQGIGRMSVINGSVARGRQVEQLGDEMDVRHDRAGSDRDLVAGDIEDVFAVGHSSAKPGDRLPEVRRGGGLALLRPEGAGQLVPRLRATLGDEPGQQPTRRRSGERNRPFLRSHPQRTQQRKLESHRPSRCLRRPAHQTGPSCHDLVTV